MSNKDASAKQLFDMFQKMVNPFAMQGLMFSGLNEEEIEKKISEMRSVESWLQANLNLLQLTIKTLEYQKTLLASGKIPGAAPPPVPQDNPLLNPGAWWNTMMKPSAKPAEKPESPEPPKKKGSKS